MKPVFQTRFAVEDAVPDQRGNCWQAALASLLETDIDAIPYFTAVHGPDHPDEGPVWWETARCWLRETYGLDLAYFDRAKFSTPRSALVQEPPPGWACIAGGWSPRGDFGHVVLVDVDGCLVHDPHPSGEGLVGDPHGWDILVRAEEALT